MKFSIVLTLALVMTSAAAVADDKPIHEVKFIKQITSFHRSLRLTGTQAQMDVQWEEFVDKFNEQFGSPFVTIDAVVSDVKWENGTAFIGFRSRTISKLYQASPLSVKFSPLSFNCDRDAALEIKPGTKVKIEVRLTTASDPLVPLLFVPAPDRKIFYRFYFTRYVGSKYARLEGRYFGTHYVATVGDRVITYGTPTGESK